MTASAAWFTPPDTERRATRMPEGFQPKARHRALAAELGVNLEEEFSIFVDHHLSKGTRFKSWDRGFDTWLRRAKQFERTRPSDAWMVFKPERPPCPFGECDGSGWWVDAATRHTVLCKCWRSLRT